MITIILTATNSDHYNRHDHYHHHHRCTYWIYLEVDLREEVHPDELPSESQDAGRPSLDDVGGPDVDHL